MSMKNGLKVFGKDSETAVKDKMQQLHDWKVILLVKNKELSYEQRKEALGYLMFLKHKSSGKIKGRGCTDGRKQHSHIAKEDTMSPTVSTEAVFLIAVVDAWENCNMVVMDVSGVFMQADMDDPIHVRFYGEMVDKLLEIDHDLYSPYIVEENGVCVLYVELLKALNTRKIN